MADKKISQLPNSSTITGEELVPIVQGGVTVQTTVNNLGTGVGYTPAGTGAVPTTVQTKLRESVSVMDFGASPSASADQNTLAINVAAAAARTLGYCLLIPTETFSVSGTLDFSSLYVYGHGVGSKIQATSNQFDVIKSTGNSIFKDFYVHGGWDGVTSGQTGNSFTLSNGAGSYAYNIRFDNVRIQFSKQNGIYWLNGGYSSVSGVKCNASGLHGIYLNGASGSVATTTVTIDKQSIFSDCPNGYGMVFNECVEVTADTVIIENTKGINVTGGSNRVINLLNIYQENTVGNAFLTLTGQGQVLNVKGCIGIGMTMPSPTTSAWPGPNVIEGNLFGETNLGGNGKITTVTGTEATATTAASVTAAAISLLPGTYLLQGTLQTLNVTSGTITSAGIYLTTGATDSGYQNQTGVNFKTSVDLLDANPGSQADIRLNNNTIIQVSTTTTVYLRVYLGITAGTVAYRGAITSTQLF